MTLTKKQFDILTYIETHKTAKNQREIADKTNMSIGSVNKTLTQLHDAEYVASGQITNAGLLALEPYRAKRAIFMAAGFGSRLIPVTLNTPKPLIRVKGVRIIDTLLDAVYAAGIKEMVIVRGYLGEQFDQLLYKYPDIRFLENPVFNQENNISSAMCARYLFQNAYVFDADNLLYNKDLVTKYQYSSNYLAVPVEMTDDWCLESKNGVITRMKLGGVHCHHMYGISYWDKTDGIKLSEHIKLVYEMPGGKERYWDQAPLEYFANEYSVSIRECTFDDITEIDSYQDLKKLDSVYV